MAFYKAYSSTGLTGIGKFIVNRKLNKIIKLISLNKEIRGLDVLEVGPGDGKLTDKLKEKGAKLVLIEPSEDLRQKLIDKGYKNILEVFVPPIPEKDNKYDLIILVNVFEHFHNHEQAVFFLKEAKRVLKQDGLLLISAPDILFWGKYFWDGDYTHNYIVSRSRLEQMFIDYDYQVCTRKLFSGFFSNTVVSALMSFIVKYPLFFVDWIGNPNLRKKFNKFRFGFLGNAFFIVKNKK